MYSGRYFVLILLLLSAQTFAQIGRKYVRVKSENVRSEPNGTKIGEALAGTEVEILEKRSNWVKVNITGWIWEKSLTSDFSRVEGYQIRASHILVETEADANKVLEQLSQGKSFEELAKQYSIDKASGTKGGDLGRFSRGDLRSDFEDAIFKLKVGEMSGVVKTGLGYHVIKRIE